MSKPETDADLVTMLRALYEAGAYSGGARDDFWDLMSQHAGWVLDLAEKGAKKRAKHSMAERGSAGGKARMAALSSDERSAIARKGAEARWGKPKQAGEAQ